MTRLDLIHVTIICCYYLLQEVIGLLLLLRFNVFENEFIINIINCIEYKEMNLLFL